MGDFFFVTLCLILVVLFCFCNHIRVVWLRQFIFVLGLDFFFQYCNFMSKTKLIQLSIFNHGYKALKSSNKWLILRLSLL